MLDGIIGTGPFNPNRRELGNIGGSRSPTLEKSGNFGICFGGGNTGTNEEIGTKSFLPHNRIENIFIVNKLGYNNSLINVIYTVLWKSVDVREIPY